MTDRPPSGVLPVTLAADVVLMRRPGLAVWAGAFSVFPGGFEFTLLTLFDVGVELPADLIRDVHRRNYETWLTIRFSDGRYREVTESSLNSPPDQPEGPQLRMTNGAASWSDGWWVARWWVSPLPPPGPVGLAVHLDGGAVPGGTAQLNGAELAAAGARAVVWWPDSEGAPA